MNATLDDLAACLDRHGSNSADWPPGVRPSLQRLARESRRARAMVEAARALESALDTLRPPPPSPNLAGRVAARLAVPAGPRPAKPRRLPGRLPAAAAAAAVVVVLALSRFAEPPTIAAGAPVGVDEDLLQEIGLTAPAIGAMPEDEAAEEEVAGVAALDRLPLD